MRILLPTDPAYDRSSHYHEASPWKARWVSHPEAPAGNSHTEPFFAEYRLGVELDAPRLVRLHVSADERYRLMLNGRPLGRGPERGDPLHWHFETFDVPLSMGTHIFTVEVWSLGEHRPYAQLSVRHGLLVMAEGEGNEAIFSTGIADWEVARVAGYGTIPVRLPGTFGATGCRFAISAAGLNASRSFVKAVGVGAAVPASARMESRGQWQLTPSVLPAMHEEVRQVGSVRHVDHTDPDRTFETAVAGRDAAAATEAEAWQAMLAGESPIVVPPHSARRVLIDLDDYYCLYPMVTVSGGAGSLIRVHTAEAMFSADGQTKHHRDRVEGLHFLGQGDDLLPDGSRAQRFSPPWYLAGRYMQIAVRTGEHPLTLHAVEITETHYPHNWETTIRTSDERIGALIPIGLRSIEMCSHETYFDCPYYEQLMYVGDTRLEALVTYAMARDDRLPRKAITLFDNSRGPDGLTSSRYPTRTTQTIPPFSFWWVAMVHDFLMWRGDMEFVRARMPGVRAVIEALRTRVDDEGLFHPFQGWNFTDWAGHLSGHARTTAQPAPFYGPGPSAIHQFHAAYTLNLAAELEAALGEDTLAARHLILCRKLRSVGHRSFFDHDRSLYRELPHGTPIPAESNWREFTEQTQSLALLSGAVPAGVLPRFAAALIAGEGMLPATIYFSHYLFEAYRLLADHGGIDAFYRRMELWYELPKRGFKTTFEQPEPTRSDCHAWGAHPLFHLYATVLGVRPAAPGFARVHVQPRLGTLGPSFAAAALVHPRGTITIETSRTETTLKLPPGVTGELVAHGVTRPV